MISSYKPDPRPQFEKVEQPMQKLTDICDTVTETCVSWITETEAELQNAENSEEEVKDLPRSLGWFQKVDAFSHYKIQYTREVEHYFNQLQKAQLPSAEDVLLKQIALPGDYSSKKTLILDLDDTLIHTINPAFNYASIGVTHSNVKTALYQDAVLEVYSVNFVIRPYALQFLKEMSEIYEIVIFTAAQKCYANAILNILDPDNKFIAHRIYRDNCIFKSGIFMKDLRIFKNRSLKSMVIVDNSITSFGRHLENGIHIPSYFGQREDSNLMLLIPFLTKLSEAEDIPRELDKKLGLRDMYEWSIKKTQSVSV